MTGDILLERGAILLFLISIWATGYFWVFDRKGLSIFLGAFSYFLFEYIRYH